MFTIYEYVADLLVILTGATLLFMACVMVLLLVEGASILARTSRKRSDNPIRKRYARLTSTTSSAELP